MWLVCKADTGEVAPGISIAAGERVLVEISRKFTVEQLQGLAYNAGLYIQVHVTRGLMGTWAALCGAAVGPLGHHECAGFCTR